MNVLNSLRTAASYVPLNTTTANTANTTNQTPIPTPSSLSRSILTYSAVVLDPTQHVQRLHTFSKSCLLTSIFFWTWAVHNTRTMDEGFDIGIVCFLASTVSSFYLYWKTRSLGGRRKVTGGGGGIVGVGGGIISSSSMAKYPSLSMYGRSFVTLTHLSVVGCYGLGFWFAMTVGKEVYVKFATYCALFCGIWLGVTYHGWTLMTNTMEVGFEMGGGGGLLDGVDEEDELEALYRGVGPGSNSTNGLRQSLNLGTSATSSSFSNAQSRR